MSSEPVIPIHTPEDVTETREPTRPRPEPTPINRQLPIDSVITAPAEPEEVAPPKMNQRAQMVGAAVGKAVGKVRELPRRVSEVRERLTVVRGRTQESALSSAVEFRDTARHKVYEARSRAEYLAHEYPIQFILGCGAAGFVLGFVLRLWRSSRRD